MGKRPRPVNIDGVWHIENKRNTVLSWLWMKIKKTEPPYYCYYSIWTIIFKPIRKWFSAVLIPTIFIGMHCYLDDVCYDLMEIGNNVTISYGAYFASHGRNQGHNRIVIKDGAYIGMKACVIARHDLEIGENAIVGAMTLVNKSIPDGKTAVGVPCRILEKKD